MRLGPPPEVEEAPGSSGRTSSATRRRCSASRPSSSSRRSSSRRGRRSATARRYVDDRLREIFDEVQPDVDRRGQRRRASPRSTARAAVGADRLVQPARDEGRRRAAGLLRLPGRATAPAGTEFRDEYATRDLATCTGSSSTILRRARRAAAAGRRVHPRVAAPQPLPVPGGGRLRRGAAARRRPGTASTRAFADRRPTFEMPDESGRRGRARLPVARLARLGRRRADAAARRRALRRAAPVHRVARGRRRRSTSSPTTCGARSSCPSRRSCRWSTSSSPTAATTRRPSASTSASR